MYSYSGRTYWETASLVSTGRLPFSTLGDVVFTQYAVKAGSALAYKAVDVILAGGAVSAGMAGTLVNLNVTALSLKTWATVTDETPDFVPTRASIQTRVCRTQMRGGTGSLNQLLNKQAHI